MKEIILKSIYLLNNYLKLIIIFSYEIACQSILINLIYYVLGNIIKFKLKKKLETT